MGLNYTPTTIEDFKVNINLLQGIRALDDSSVALSVVYSLIFLLALWSLVPALEILLTGFSTNVRARDLGVIGVFRTLINPVSIIQRNILPRRPELNQRRKYRRIICSTTAALFLLGMELIFILGQFTPLSDPVELDMNFRASYSGVSAERTYDGFRVGPGGAFNDVDVAVAGAETNLSISVQVHPDIVNNPSSGILEEDERSNKSFRVGFIPEWGGISVNTTAVGSHYGFRLHIEVLNLGNRSNPVEVDFASFKIGVEETARILKEIARMSNSTVCDWQVLPQRSRPENFTIFAGLSDACTLTDKVRRSVALLFLRILIAGVSITVEKGPAKGMMTSLSKSPKRVAKPLVRIRSNLIPVTVQLAGALLVIITSAILQRMARASFDDKVFVAAKQLFGWDTHASPSRVESDEVYELEVPDHNGRPHLGYEITNRVPQD